jgi:hypothetical protein
VTTSTVRLVQKPPPPPSRFLDERGYVSREWILFLSQLQIVSNTALESSDSGTAALFANNMAMILGRINELDERITALEVTRTSAPITPKQKESTDIFPIVLAPVEKKDEQIPIVTPPLSLKTVEQSIDNSFLFLMYDKMIKKINELETLIAMK